MNNDMYLDISKKNINNNSIIESILNNINLFNVLGVSYDTPNDDIIHAYNLQLKTFYNKQLNEDDILNIKILKIARYILTNPIFKEHYNAKYIKLDQHIDNIYQLPKHVPLKKEKAVNTRFLESMELFSHKQNYNQLLPVNTRDTIDS